MFSLIKDKMANIIEQYENIVQKVRVVNDLSRKTKSKLTRKMTNNDELKGGKFVKFDS